MSPAQPYYQLSLGNGRVGEIFNWSTYLHRWRQMVSMTENKFCYLLLLAAHVSLVWFLPYFPTQDGPSHLYNLVILRDLVNGGQEWGTFFDYRLRANPNLGYHIVAYPLLHFFSPLVVEKIVVSIYIFLMGTAIPLFLRTFGSETFPKAYFVFPVIFNFTLLMGFFSYTLAVPIFLLFFALCWRTRNRSIWHRLVYYNAAGLIIYYFHLVPFIYFMLALSVSVMLESRTMIGKFHELGKLFAILMPTAINFLYYLGTQPAGHTLELREYLSIERSIDLVKDLFFFSSVNFSPWQMLPASVFGCLIMVMAYPILKKLCHYRSGTDDIKITDRTLVYLTLVMSVIYFVAPFSFGGGSYFNQRLPWVILLTSLPFLSFPGNIISPRFLSRLLAVTAFLCFAINASVIRQQSTIISKYLAGLQADLPKRSFIMPYKSADTNYSRIDVLMHGAAYYGIFKGCVNISDYEAGRPYFPVRFRNSLPPFPSSDQIIYEPGTIKWAVYPAIQFLISWKTANSESRKLSQYFEVIWQDAPVSIWKRRDL